MRNTLYNLATFLIGAGWRIKNRLDRDKIKRSLIEEIDWFNANVKNDTL